MADRLQKILASAGLGSRRTCEQWIREGRVSVDGVIVDELGAQADPSVNKIAVDGRVIPPPPKRRQYIALNKPRGYACTLSDPHAVHIITELVDLPGKPMLRPVGRLDIETEGLIFLTDDGEFVNKLTHPRYHVAKTYMATVRGRPDEEALTRLGNGVMLEDGLTAPADSVRFVRYFPATDTTDVELVIHEGRNRQVRRMFAAVGHNVMRLIRTRIGTVTTHSMPSGTWRHLTPTEIDRLMTTAKPVPQRAVAERPRIIKAAAPKEVIAPAKDAKPTMPRRGGAPPIDKRGTPMPQSQINARRYGKNTRRNIENGQSFRKNRDQPGSN